MSNPGVDHGPNQAYVLGHSDQELPRLNEQARIVEPITRRFFREAGLVPGLRVRSKNRTHSTSPAGRTSTLLSARAFITASAQC
jgi:hypothetical protein